MIEKIDRFNVLRDDLTFGGTKRIALERWLPGLETDKVSYAGSVFGWGAPALAAACAELGIKCVILISESKYTPPWLDRLKCLPAKVIVTPPTPVELLGEQLKRDYSDYQLLPPGFDASGFQDAIWSHAAEFAAPVRAWVPVISGTLLRALEKAWPETEFHGVCAARKHGYTGKATLHMAPEKFSQSAENPPPYPACPFSDAKVWQFAAQLGKPDDLIWNTNP